MKFVVQKTYFFNGQQEFTTMCICDFYQEAVQRLGEIMSEYTMNSWKPWPLFFIEKVSDDQVRSSTNP